MGIGMGELLIGLACCVLGGGGVAVVAALVLTARKGKKPAE